MEAAHVMKAFMYIFMHKQYSHAKNDKTYSCICIYFVAYVSYVTYVRMYSSRAIHLKPDNIY